MFKTTAKVQVKNQKNEVIASKDYQKVVFEGTSADAKGKPTFDTTDKDAIEKLLGATIAFFQEEVGTKGNGVIELLKNATYAYDLGVRAKIRQSLVTAAEGPDKATEKMVKDYMAVRQAKGKPVTEEQARAKVAAMLAAADEE